MTTTDASPRVVLLLSCCFHPCRAVAMPSTAHGAFWVFAPHGMSQHGIVLDNASEGAQCVIRNTCRVLAHACQVEHVAEQVIACHLMV